MSVNIFDETYLNLAREILDKGRYTEDRTGTGSYQLFGAQMRFDLSKGFPILTTKKIHLRSIVHELIWFISGDTNIKYLQDNGVTIWDEWADENGDLGPVYGKQWTNFGARKFKISVDGVDMDVETSGINQLNQAVKMLKESPNSRRIIISAWDPNEVDDMALPPCHCMFQLNAERMTKSEILNCRFNLPFKEYLDKFLTACEYGDDVILPESIYKPLDELHITTRRLNCQLYQRSADYFLGVPFNIAEYAELTEMLAQVCQYGVGDFVWTGGCVHIYFNHLDQIREQLDREPYPLTAKLVLNPDIKNLEDFKYEDIQIVDYVSHPAIKAPVAV